MAVRLLCGILLVLLLTSNLGLANSEEPMKEASFETKVSTMETISVSQDILERLREITEKLVRNHLPVDYQKSGKVTAEIKILAKTENGYHCESMVTFLYRETFTAVLVRIEFHYIPEQIGDIEIQRF